MIDSVVNTSNYFYKCKYFAFTTRHSETLNSLKQENTCTALNNSSMKANCDEKKPT